MWLLERASGWLTTWLQWVGFVNKSGKIVFLGLDNAGKTTLLGILARGELRQHSPTWQPNNDIIQIGNATFNAFDVGGHKQARGVWNDYTCGVDGLVFMVDSTDTERMEEAGIELRQILANQSLQNIPIAILANKVDRPQCISKTDIIARLGVYQTLESNEKIKLFMVSVAKKRGYSEAFQWIATFL